MLPRARQTATIGRAALSRPALWTSSARALLLTAPALFRSEPASRQLGPSRLLTSAASTPSPGAGSGAGSSSPAAPPRPRSRPPSRPFDDSKPKQSAPKKNKLIHDPIPFDNLSDEHLSGSPPDPAKRSSEFGPLTDKETDMVTSTITPTEQKTLTRLLLSLKQHGVNPVGGVSSLKHGLTSAQTAKAETASSIRSSRMLEVLGQEADRQLKLFGQASSNNTVVIHESKQKQTIASRTVSGPVSFTDPSENGPPTPDPTDMATAQQATNIATRIQNARSDVAIWKLLNSEGILPPTSRHASSLLAHAHQTLDQQFPHSPLADAILPSLKRLGPAAEIAATSTALFNSAIFRAWRVRADAREVIRLWADMDRLSLSINYTTIAIFDKIVREFGGWNQASWVLRAVKHSLELYPRHLNLEKSQLDYIHKMKLREEDKAKDKLAKADSLMQGRSDGSTQQPESQKPELPEEKLRIRREEQVLATQESHARSLLLVKPRFTEQYVNVPRTFPTVAAAFLASHLSVGTGSIPNKAELKTLIIAAAAERAAEEERKDSGQQASESLEDGAGPVNQSKGGEVPSIGISPFPWLVSTPPLRSKYFITRSEELAKRRAPGSIPFVPSSTDLQPGFRSQSSDAVVVEPDEVRKANGLADKEAESAKRREIRAIFGNCTDPAELVRRWTSLGEPADKRERKKDVGDGGGEEKPLFLRQDPPLLAELKGTKQDLHSRTSDIVNSLGPRAKRLIERQAIDGADVGVDFLFGEDDVEEATEVKANDREVQTEMQAGVGASEEKLEVEVEKSEAGEGKSIDEPVKEDEAKSEEGVEEAEREITMAETESETVEEAESDKLEGTGEQVEKEASKGESM